MEPKLKECSSCGKLSRLWRSTPKLCKPCAMKHNVKDKPKEITAQWAAIKPVSDKQAKLNRLYAIAAAQFKKDKGCCIAKLTGCTGKPDHVHHLFSGASRSKYFLDQTTWITCCNNCHHLIHDVMEKDELINLGLKRIE